MKTKTNTTNANLTGINKQDLYLFKEEIKLRVDSIFTSRPTWSRMSCLEDETIRSIEQALDEETAKLEKKLQS